jgi:hypothetical protein
VNHDIIHWGNKNNKAAYFDMISYSDFYLKADDDA